MEKLRTGVGLTVAQLVWMCLFASYAPSTLAPSSTSPGSKEPVADPEPGKGFTLEKFLVNLVAFVSSLLCSRQSIELQRIGDGAGQKHAPARIQACGQAVCENPRFSDDRGQSPHLVPSALLVTRPLTLRSPGQAALLLQCLIKLRPKRFVDLTNLTYTGLFQDMGDPRKAKLRSETNRPSLDKSGLKDRYILAWTYTCFLAYFAVLWILNVLLRAQLVLVFSQHITHLLIRNGLPNPR